MRNVFLNDCITHQLLDGRANTHYAFIITESEHVLKRIKEWHGYSNSNYNYAYLD